MLRIPILRAALFVVAFLALVPARLLAAAPAGPPPGSSARADEPMRRPTVLAAAPWSAAPAAPGRTLTASFVVRNNSGSTRTFSFAVASSDAGVASVGAAPRPRSLAAGGSVAVQVPYTVKPSEAGTRARITLTATDAGQGTLAHSASVQHTTAAALAAPEAWWNGGGSNWNNPDQAGSATIRVTNNSNTARTLCFNAPPYGRVTPSIFSEGPTPPACRVFQAYETVNPMTVTYRLRPGAPAGEWDDIHAQVYDQDDPALNNYAAPAWIHVYVNEYVGSPTVGAPAGQTGVPGESRTAHFTVQNNSNSTRSFSFAAASSNPGVAAAGSAPGPQTLAAGQSITVAVPYTVQPGAAGSAAQVTLTATDTGDGTLAGSAAMTHTTGVKLAAPEAWWNGGGSNWTNPDQAGSATIRVTNNSNTARTLCFNAPAYGRVTPSIFSGGPTPPACRVFQAYETVSSLTVTYTVRSGAPAGEWDDLHAQVHDQADPALNNHAATAWLHVYVNEYVGSPTVAVTQHPSGVPGGTATAKFDVRNNSNSPRSFSFAVSASDPAVAQMGAAPATLPIGAGQTASVSVTYGVNPSAQGTTAQITLRATDTQNAALVHTAAATHSTGILLAAPEAWWNGGGSSWTGPGQTGSATLRVTNRSNAVRTLCFTAPAFGRVTPSIFLASPAAPACRVFQPYETFNPAGGPLAVTYTLRPDAVAGVWDDIQARVHDQAVPGLNNHDATAWMHVYVAESLARPTVTPGAASGGVPGSTQAAGFTVRNNSNAPRTFTLSVLQSDGAVVQVGAAPGPQALEPWQAVAVQVPYTVKPGAAGSTARIILGATDSQDGALWHSAEVAHTTAELLASPTVTAPAAGTREPGTYTAGFTLTNHSNVSRTFAFSVSSSDPAVVQAGAAPQAQEVPAGQTVTVGVPWTLREAAAGSTAQVTLVATDTRDAGKTHSAAMTRTVAAVLRSPAVTAPPAQSDAPGAQRSVDFTVENRSNTGRTLLLSATSSSTAVVGDPADPAPLRLAAFERRTVSVSYTPLKRGSATVRLTATDSADATRTGGGELVATVLNSAPTARLVFGPADPLPGEAIRFDASGSTDPDGDPLTYSWDFGDGRGYTGTGTPISVAYAAPGSYRFVVQASDGQGGTHADTVQVDVVADAQAPGIAFSPGSGTFDRSERAVEVVWTDARGMDKSSLTLRLNGQEVPFWGTNWIENTWARSTNTLHLAPGPNTLVATVRDRAGNVARDSVTYTFNAFVDVEVGASVGLTVNANTATAHSFQVTNTGTVGASFRLRAWCTGPLTNCGLQGDSLLYLPAGTTLSVPTAYTTGQSGTGLLWLKATAANDTTVTSEASLSVIVTGGAGTPAPALVTATGTDPLELPRSTSAPVRFSVANPGTAVGRYALATSCPQGSLGCTLPADTIQVDPAEPVNVDVQVTASGDVGENGTVTLTATLVGEGSARSAGRMVTITDPNSQAPTVVLDPATSTGLLERDLCLTVAAGHEGASECGDLRLAHALPTVRTFNKARTPVLLYNSQHSEPNPLVALDITARPSDEPLAEMQVTVSGGPAGAKWSFTKSWPGAQFPAGQARRVVVSDAALVGLPTGIHTYQVTVSAVYGTTPHPAPARSGELVVVNRRLDPAGTQLNPLGAGWWLAGLERIYRQGDDLVWVGGDGSVRRFSPGPDGTWAGPPLAGPDRIVRGPDNGYVRELKGGVSVIFDFGGRHVATENRQGHRTVFGYQGEALTTITVPTPGQAAMTYVFDYSTAGEVRITAPGAPARQTVVSLVDGTVRSIRDPDQTAVRFEYYGNSGYVRYRDNRLLHRSEYRYDPTGRVSAGKIHMDPAADSIVVRIRPQQSRGHAGPVPLDSVNTFVDGPRTDVADSTRFWLDRFGAPWKIRNAHGDSTVVRRGDLRWPALVTWAKDFGDVETTASYDGRGNVDSVAVLNPLGDLRNAVTRYEWDARWDVVKKITLPEREVTEFGYDPANGNRLWQQDGRGDSTRVHFGFNAAGQLTSVHPEAAIRRGEAPQRYGYHPQTGNLVTATTPLSYLTEFFQDAVGRDTLVVSPVSSTRRLRTTVSYDGAGRDTLSITYGDTEEGDLRVTTAYDAEGNRQSVSRRSSLDQQQIGALTRGWAYDRVGRVKAERSESNDTTYTYYDAAGNDTLTVTPRRAPIRQQFDVMNRLVRRIVPEAAYDSVSGDLQVSATGQFLQRWTFPETQFANGPAGRFVIPEDTASFRYDPRTGAMLAADNRDAQVRRSYYRNGQLRTDTLKIRTWAELKDGGSWTQHAYGLEYLYDLNGRRVELRHPTNIAPKNENTGRTYGSQTYGYQPGSGALAWVKDVLDLEYRFFYDAEGRADSVSYPGSRGRKLRYDADGNMTYKREAGWYYSTQGSLYQMSEANVLYDQRGKARSVDDNGFAPEAAGTRSMTYTLLGRLSQLRGSGYGSGGVQPGVRPDERYKWDALGHRLESWPTSQANPTISRYRQGTGRLHYSGPAADTVALEGHPLMNWAEYDLAGNQTWYQSERYAMNTNPMLSLVRSYYGHDDKPRAGETRRCDTERYALVGNEWKYSCKAPYTLNDATAGAFEWYRYDALGRRVQVRARRDHICEPESADCSSTITRFVWDGDHILYEIRAPGGEVSASTLEDDDARGAQFGRVAYTHGPEIDKPLDIIRMGYLPPFNGYGFESWGGPHPVIPFSNWHGVMVGGSTAAGRKLPCQTGGTQCVVTWPGSGYSAFLDRSTPLHKKTWYGSLVNDQEDATGFRYMRNRYYNPESGTFTQQDPIGLAGGLNVYGFAEGDPVSYSDPYGLSAEAREDSNCGVCVRLLLNALLRVSPRAAGAAATAGVAASRLVPGGGLGAHEAMGGHTLREHVGRTVPQMMARFAAQPHLRMTSTFFNRGVAEAATSGALQANATQIQNWLASGGTRLILQHQVGTAVGNVLVRGASSPVVGTGVRVVLDANPASPVGYQIVTSYVTR